MSQLFFMFYPTLDFFQGCGEQTCTMGLETRNSLCPWATKRKAKSVMQCDFMGGNAEMNFKLRRRSN